MTHVNIFYLIFTHKYNSQNLQEPPDFFDQWLGWSLMETAGVSQSGGEDVITKLRDCNAVAAKSPARSSPTWTMR